MPQRLHLHLVTSEPPAAPIALPAPRPRRTWRQVLAGVLLSVFYVLPWLQLDGRQALLFDLSARRFDLFGLVLWPQDLGVLLGLAAVLAAALALVTNLAGRVWCGHACPQTLWTGLFDGIARLTSRNALPGPLRTVLRHTAWIVVAMWTGITFVGFFSPIRGLVCATPWPPTWSGWETFWVLFYAAATWGNAAFLRQQVCTYICPYARLQGLLCDDDTPMVRYHARRGEPRGPRAPGQDSALLRPRGLLDPTTAQDYVFRAAHPAIAGAMPKFAPEHLGDCLDCGACAAACPIGLDVRNAVQHDCIACGHCIDVCNAQMRANGFPQGLIVRASQHRMQQHPRRLLRPRTLCAALALLVLLGIGMFRFWPAGPMPEHDAGSPRVH